MTRPLLELVGVRAGYGPVEVLHGVDLTLYGGEVLALMGPNGAGKTTLLKVCSGQLPATAGEVRIAGNAVTGADPAALARLGLCTIPEGRGIFPNLTVRENLWLATASGCTLAHIEAVAYERFPVLGSRRGQLAGTLSGGEQQMLALSRALATDPAILLLDELSMGLAPRVVGEMYEVVAALAQSGVTVLVAEQFARAVLPIADRAALVQQGRVVDVRPASEVETDLSAS